MIGQPTLEGELKYVKDEIHALKTAQPFYDGQFTLITGATPAAFDQEFLFPAGASNLRGYVELTALNQLNPMGTLYVVFLDGSNNEFPSYTFRVKQTPLYYLGDEKTLYFYTEATATFAVPTTVRLKYFLVASDICSLSYQSWEIL